jgi:ABC-type Co2+ transport system permease subunit
MTQRLSHPVAKQWALVVAAIIASAVILTVTKRLLNVEFPTDMVVWTVGFGVWYRYGGREIILRTRQRSKKKAE